MVEITSSSGSDTAEGSADGVELVVHGSVATVRVSGAIDLDNSFALTAAGLQALESAATEVVVDLSGVSFMDSTGIGALVEIRNGAEDRATPLRLSGLTAPVVRLLAITGLNAAFGLPDDAGRH